MHTTWQVLRAEAYGGEVRAGGPVSEGLRALARVGLMLWLWLRQLRPGGGG